MQHYLDSFEYRFQARWDEIMHAIATSLQLAPDQKLAGGLKLASCPNDQKQLQYDYWQVARKFVFRQG